MQATMVVLQLPPSWSVSNLVSFESQYGMNFFPFPFDNAETTFPSAEMLLLMFFASRSHYPLEPDFETHSDPARSTIVISDFQ